jgi:hypothetical protein
MNALERNVDRNVRDLKDRVVAKFVHWDGHDTDQRDDTNAVGKRKAHLIILTRLPQERYAGGSRKVQGKARSR